MKQLLSTEGRDAIRKLLEGHPLLAFDFDGTLAPIVTRPEVARIPLPALRRLVSLVHVARVAIVTGRAADDVKSRLGFEPHYVVGNHGIEAGHALDLTVWTTSLDPLREEIKRRWQDLEAAGVTVEDKQLSLALHYRLAPNHDRAVGSIESVLAMAAQGLRVMPGKCVLNVMDPRAPDKGDAMIALVTHSGCDSALFVGDDENDEPVFIKAPPSWVTVRVGPEHAYSRARFYIGSPNQIPVLLQLLLDELGDSSTKFKESSV